MVQGVLTGSGKLEMANGQCYSGAFRDGSLNGEGKFYVKHGSYSLEGNFTNGQPDVPVNKYIFKLLSPVVDDAADMKASKDKKMPQLTDEDPDA